MLRRSQLGIVCAEAGLSTMSLDVVGALCVGGLTGSATPDTMAW
jgi:hypothetical protein